MKLLLTKCSSSFHSLSLSLSLRSRTSLLGNTKNNKARFTPTQDKTQHATRIAEYCGTVSSIHRTESVWNVFPNFITTATAPPEHQESDALSSRALRFVGLRLTLMLRYEKELDSLSFVSRTISL
jgi:hypothetical protein